MMKKFTPLIISVGIIIFSLTSAHAQITTPEKKAFNLGIFSGIGGVNFTPIPGVEVYYKRNILRVAPGYKVIGAGYIREIIPLSKVFYNWYWIASLYGARGTKNDEYALSSVSTFYQSMLLTGAKVYFSLRWYTQLQGGVSYVKTKTPGFPTDTDITPFFEFSLGVNIFKSYVNEMDFE